MVIQLSEKEKRDIIVSQIDKSMFVEAGAGAGKTTLIKNRIVNQLKQGILPGEIVAITFTNAATRELRERIVDAVLKESQRPDLKETEKENLNRALDSIDQMQISTIHSFCNRILKEKSLDAHIPMDIELIEGAELDRKKKECFTRWAEGLKKPDWDRLLEEGKYRSSVITKLENLFEQLLSVDKEIPVKFVLPQVDKASFEIGAKRFLEEFEKVVVESTKEAYGALLSTDRLPGKITDIEDDKMTSHGKRVKEAMLSGDPLPVFKELLKEQTGENFIIKAPTLTCIKSNLSELKGKQKEEAAKERQGLAKESLSNIRTLFDSRKTWLNTLVGGYENYLYTPYIDYAKKARDYFYEELGTDLLTNDLLIQKTYQLLSSSAEARKYFGDKFRCIYVDEFQDTDHIQEAFIRLLAEDSKHPGELRDGALFVVGDPKQSIYRFRGAEPEIYFQTKQYFSSRDNAYVLELQDNYRSNSEIIEWVNAAFCSKPITQGQAYVPMQATRQLPVHLIGDKTIHGVYCQNSVFENQKDQSIDTDVENVTNLILNLVNGGYEIIDYKDDIPFKRNILFSDILIMCMYTSDMDLYAENFRLYGIPVSMDSKISVKEQEYLKVFYRIFKYLLNPFDRTYEAGAIEGLTMLGHEKDNAKYVLSLLNSQVKEMSAIGILGFLEKNWKVFLNVQTDYSESLIRKIRARITQMTGNLMSSRPGSSSAICSFLEDYLESEIEHELSLEEGANAVRFMNLHKAKGLEGNIVIWANRQERTNFREGSFLNNGVFYPAIKGKHGMIWCGYNRADSVISDAREKDASEKIRLEYVAVTRAKQAVIFMDRYQSNAVLFGEGYEAIQNSINDVLKNQNTPMACNPKTEDFSVETTLVAEEECKKPLFLSESPSDFEDDTAGKSESRNAVSGRSSRPAGAILGIVMHRAFELLVGRLITTHGKQGIFPEIGEKLIKSCYLQAIQESKNDIPKEEVPVYQSFLREAVFAYGKWWVQEGMTEKIDNFYTELPFSYFILAGENQIWRHGFADLVLKLINGNYLIIDYKSDSDESYASEDDFIHRLEGKYGPQLCAYKEAIKTVFGIEESKIHTILISFSEKDTKKNEKLRIRITELQ